MSGVVVQLIAVRRIDECGHCRKDCSGFSVPGRCRREDGPHHAVPHPGKGGQGRFNFISWTLLMRRRYHGSRVLMPFTLGKRRLCILGNSVSFLCCIVLADPPSRPPYAQGPGPRCQSPDLDPGNFDQRDSGRSMDGNNGKREHHRPKGLARYKRMDGGFARCHPGCNSTNTAHVSGTASPKGTLVH